MKNYPLFKVHVPIDDIMSRIRTVLESGYINEGTEVTQLTQKMQEQLETYNLILVNSCTSALTLALKLAGVEPGDEVITTPMTCVATNTPIDNLGAKIVWADIDPRTGMIDPLDVAKKVTSKTKAVMAVAWAGTPPDLLPLFNFCEHLKIKLILDAAHAFGAYYNDVPAHQWAHYTCYSFQAIKHVTTGDGGALVSKEDNDYRRSKALKWFGLDRDAAKDANGNWKGQQWDVDIVEPGFKFNMNNISAAIGLAQIDHIDHIIGMHQCNAALYDELFEGTTSVHPAEIPLGSESTRWVYTMRIGDTSISRDDLLKKLNEEGIHAGVVHVPNDDYTAFDHCRVSLPGVREFARTQFSLPCGWWLSEDDVRHIARRVRELTK